MNESLIISKSVPTIFISLYNIFSMAPPRAAIIDACSITITILIFLAFLNMQVLVKPLYTYCLTPLVS